MRSRFPTIALIVVLGVLAAGLGGLAWIAGQQREVLHEQAEENRQLRRELAATQRKVTQLEEGLDAVLMLASDRSLVDRVADLEEAVGEKPLGLNSRAAVAFDAGLWDEIGGIGRDLDEVQRCVDSIASAIQFNYGFILC